MKENIEESMKDQTNKLLVILNEYPVYFYIFIVLTSVSMLLELILMIFVFANKRLRVNRFRIIGALMLTNVFSSATGIIGTLFYIHPNKYEHLQNGFVTLLRVLHMVSLLILCFLTIDRFIAVRFCLRYTSIATPKRYLIVIVAFYIIISLICASFWIGNSFASARPKLIILNSIIRETVVVVVISVSRYTYVTRKHHITSINAVDMRFGKIAEKLSLLRQIKQSLKDTVKLNLFTIGLVVVQDVFDIWSLNDPSKQGLMQALVVLVELILMITNPFVHLFTQQSIIEAIKNAFNSRVDVVNNHLKITVAPHED